MSAPRGNRRYLQAQATRADILAAARRLFAERGYSATSMAAIAEAAGTAVQTIYDSVGSKKEVLNALFELIELPVAGAWQQLATVNDGLTALKIGVGLARAINELSGDLIAIIEAAASSEPWAASALRIGMQRHIDGTQRLAANMALKAWLRPGVSAESAGIAIGVLTAASVWRELTGNFGWSYEAAEAWIVETLAALLLPGTVS